MSSYAGGVPLSASTPDLAALDLFLSVVRLGSVSKAAEAHFITQPSASSRIRNLEARLGLVLLERSPGGSVPTTEGSLVAGWAEAVIGAAETLAAGVDALQARKTGLLRLAASFTIAEYLLPGWLEGFLRSRPDDSLELDVTNSTEVVARLEAGTADLGFVETPLEIPGMSSTTVATDQLVVVVGPGHPWAGRERVPIEALATTPLVVREKGSGTREAFDAALRQAELGDAMTAIELGSTSAVRALVATGGSPSVMSLLAVADDLRNGSLIAIEVEGLHIKRELRAVWPETVELAPLARTLLAHIARVSA